MLLKELNRQYLNILNIHEMYKIIQASVILFLVQCNIHKIVKVHTQMEMHGTPIFIVLALLFQFPVLILNPHSIKQQNYIPTKHPAIYK